METQQIEKRQRTLVGWIVAIIFYGFNILAAMATTFTLVGDAPGAADAFGSIVMAWIVGAGILGIPMVLTRGNKVTITRTRE